MIRQFISRKRLAGALLAGTAIVAGLAMGAERVVAFGFRGGGGFGGFHGGAFHGGGGFAGFHGGGGFQRGGFAGGGSRFGDSGVSDRSHDAGFGQGARAHRSISGTQEARSRAGRGSAY